MQELWLTKQLLSNGRHMTEVQSTPFFFTDTLHILMCLTLQPALVNTHHTHSKWNWAEETLTINVVGMVAQDVSVELGCLVILVKRLVQACQVVGGCHGDGAVVGFIMLGIRLWSLQWSFIVFLCKHLRHFLQCQQHIDFSLTSPSSHSPSYHSFLFHLFHSLTTTQLPPKPTCLCWRFWTAYCFWWMYYVWLQFYNFPTSADQWLWTF